jgi:hypothetical protein
LRLPQLPSPYRSSYKVGDYYQLIGTYFVLELMDGEAAQMLKRAEVLMQKFDIH